MKKYLISLAVLFTISIGVVYAQTPIQDPVVIIPGTMASMNVDVMFDPTPATLLEGWRFTPTVKQYDQLIQSFLDAGLVENEDFFIAYYDWRQSNADSAVEYLIPTINRALANSSTGKVDIVAHSMGGLVARSYIQSNSYGNNVDQFIMMGTPNEGSSDVYTLWEGGFIPKNWEQSQRSALGGFLWYMKIITQGTSDKYDTIRQFVPSVQELLPTYDYLVDKDSGVITAVSVMQEQNSFLINLNLESNKSKLLENVLGGVSIIAGDGESTVGNIPVVPQVPGDGKLWADGKPSPLSPERNNIAGDNRVLLSSALLEVEVGVPSLSLKEEKETWLSKIAKLFTPVAYAQFFPPFVEPINTKVITAKHGDLPTQSIPEIFSILGMDAPSIAYEPIPEPDAILTFWFASPIEIKITSPSGGVTTKTLSSIPGATYDGATDPLGFKMVVIENPEVGEYLVELLGLVAGGYHMGVGSFSDNGDVNVTVQGDVAQDQRIAYNVQYDPANTQMPAEISESLEVSSTPEQLFEKFRIALAETEANKHLKKRLLKKINKAEKYYNKGKIRKANKALSKVKKTIKKAVKKRKYGLEKEEAGVLLGILEEIEEAIQTNEGDHDDDHKEEKKHKKHEKKEDHDHKKDKKNHGDDKD